MSDIRGFRSHYWSGPLFFRTGKTYHKGGNTYYEMLDIFFDLDEPSKNQSLDFDDSLIVFTDTRHFSRPVKGSDGEMYTVFAYIDDNSDAHFYKAVSQKVSYTVPVCAAHYYWYWEKTGSRRCMIYYPEFDGDGQAPSREEWKKIMERREADFSSGQQTLFTA